MVKLFRILLALVWIGGFGGLLPAQTNQPDKLTSAHIIRPDKDFRDDPGSIIKRFVDPLTHQDRRSIRSLLNSDQEHASSIAPVLTPEKPVYIHYSRRLGTNQHDFNYVLEDGKVFVNYETPYDPSKMPQVKIRPIDGGEDIPFLIRTFLYPRELSGENGTLDILIRMPIIFEPEIEIQSVSLGVKGTDFRISSSATADTITVSIPIQRRDLESAMKTPGEALQVLVEGVVKLKDYDVLPSYRFRNIDDVELDSHLIGIARLISGRDYWGEQELRKIEEIATNIRRQESDSYKQVLLANRFASDRIRYFRNSMRRTAIQVLTEGIGDCDDYTRVMISILRALGIPCKVAIGYLYDFNSLGVHAWVQLALPTKNGKMHWFISDPTLASVTTEKDYFVQFRNRVYLYPLKFDVRGRNLPVDESTDILLNWRGKDEGKLSPQAFQTIIASFEEDLQKSVASKAIELRQAKATMTREFLFAAGSDYILTDRVVVPDRSRLQTKLTSDEKLVLELGVVDDDFDLEGEREKQVLEEVRSTYQRLRQALFKGMDARYCLELSYIRDKYTDRLQKVSLQVCRYLLEEHFQRVMEACEKENLLTKSEVERIDRIYQLSAGKNMYYLQELARRRNMIASPEPVVEMGAGEETGDRP